MSRPHQPSSEPPIEVIKRRAPPSRLNTGTFSAPKVIQTNKPIEERRLDYDSDDDYNKSRINDDHDTSNYDSQPRYNDSRSLTPPRSSYDRSPPRGYNDGPSRTYDGPPSRSYDSPRSRGYDGPSRNYEGPPSRGYDGPPSRGYDGPSRNYSDGPSRGYNDDISRGYNDHPSRSYGNNPRSYDSRGYDGPSRYNDGPSRGYDGPPSRSYDGPPTRSYDGPPSRGYDGPSSRSYDGPPSRSYDGPSSRSYDVPSARSYDGPLTKGYDNDYDNRKGDVRRNDPRDYDDYSTSSNGTYNYENSSRYKSESGLYNHPSKGRFKDDYEEDDRGHYEQDLNFEHELNQRSNILRQSSTGTILKKSLPDNHTNTTNTNLTTNNDSKLTVDTSINSNDNAINNNPSSLTPVKNGNYDFRPLLSSTYRNLKQFILSPCPSGVTTRCYIERHSSSKLLNLNYFSLCADLEDGTGRELMVCKKVLQARKSYYIFSLKSEDLYLKREQRSRLYLAKLRKISDGLYVLYDSGVCSAPDYNEDAWNDCNDLMEDIKINDEIEEKLTENPSCDVHEDIQRKLEATVRVKNKMSEMQSNLKYEEMFKNMETKNDENSLLRRELLVIQFNSRTRPVEKGIRGMEICIPRPIPPSFHLRPRLFQISSPFEQILQTKKQNKLYENICMVFHERASRYDPVSSCLVDFKGRAHVSSVKNFQMIKSTALEDIPDFKERYTDVLEDESKQDFVIQMGKVSDECFNMDVKSPISLLQAFATCIARFDAKLS